MTRPTAAPLIDARSLCASYPEARSLVQLLRNPLARRSRVEALSDVSFTVYPGQIFGLLGPNGAGKTTLVKILTSLMVPIRGEATIAGFDLRTAPLQVRRNLGFVSSDERSFFWRLSGHENLSFFATLYEIPKSKARERIQQLAEEFGVSKMLHRRFGLYSSGQKKLFGIIRALLSDPSVVLLDEPTNSLDPAATKHLLNYVKNELATAGRAILWATHRLEEVRLLCDRVLLISEGSCRFTGTAEEFERVAQNESESGESMNALINAFESLTSR